MTRGVKRARRFLHEAKPFLDFRATCASAWDADKCLLRKNKMIREKLQQRMDQAARNYANTRDPKFKKEVEDLKRRLIDLSGIERALAVLDKAVNRCRHEDVRSVALEAALQFLEMRADRKWPFEQFRQALESDGSEGWQVEGRYQMLNASLNGIKLAVVAHCGR